MIKLQRLGPGLLFAGAAIGVSHLVQSTRAGADFGMGLFWAMLLINVFKYPFFQYGPRFALATNTSLLDGYQKLGKGYLISYFIISLASMFTIQTAVTIVTAGLASELFGLTTNLVVWSVIIVGICMGILFVGRYTVLDKLMKVIIITLSISTLTAVIFAVDVEKTIHWSQVFPLENTEIAFLIAFMGWMPAPLDISVWHSLWSLEKKKSDPKISLKSSLFDFNVGYITSFILGVCFLVLGALTMFESGKNFSNNGNLFAAQFIDMYTKNLGSFAYVFIATAALTTMLSTTLTTLDASPRVMAKTSQLLNLSFFKSYNVWLVILGIGTSIIFIFFLSEMGLLVKIATILSFLTTPFFAVFNYILIYGKHTPIEHKPSKKMKLLSIIGMLFLFSFSIWFLITLLH